MSTSSSDRAPDGMSTELIYKFIDHAYDRISDWELVVVQNRDRLANAERALAAVGAEYKTYANWLRIRNQEAAEDD